MKKFLTLTATAAIPFLLVWIAFVLTGFSFNPYNVFENGNFWGVSSMYWFLWVCMSPMLVELIYDKKFILIGLVASTMLFSCSSSSPRMNAIQIQPKGEVDGKPVFDVTLSSGKQIQAMYPEEILEGLKTDKWKYNEDLSFKVSTVHNCDYIIEVMDKGDTALYYTIYDNNHDLVADSVTKENLDRVIIADNQ